MNLFRRLVAILAAVIGLNANAGSYSDLWWNSSESGWGINLVQQYATMFATMFVYDPDGKARWYFGSALATTPAYPWRYAGDLYETTGPWFGGAFDPDSVTVRKVGTMTFEADRGMGTMATLTYSIDGADISKRIRRQTWQTIPVGGRYKVQTLSVPASTNECATGVDLGSYNDMTVSDSGTSGIIRILTSTGTEVCRITGAITQEGQLKRIVDGKISCPSAGFSGTAHVLDWRVEGGTSPLIESSQMFMSGQIYIVAPTGARSRCESYYVFAGVAR